MASRTVPEISLDDVGPNSAEARIIKILKANGTSTVTEIARHSGLAKSTVSTSVATLRASGIIVETEQDSPDTGRRGRPANALSLNPRGGTCLGVLLGESFVQLTLSDVAHTIHYEGRVELGQDYSVKDGIAATMHAIDLAYKQTDFARRSLLGVGFAIPGPVDPSAGRVMLSTMAPRWEGVDLKESFASLLDVPIFADNESNCGAIAEMTWGAAKGEKDFLFFKLDAGVGGAIVIHGQIYKGTNGLAGEVGHVSMDPNGPLCHCGNRGCLEVYAGSKSIVEPARRVLGSDLTYEALARLALEGNAGCRRLIEDAAVVSGRGLAMLCSILNPPLVVLSGRQMIAAPILIPPLRQSFERSAPALAGLANGAQPMRIVEGAFKNNQDAAMGALGLVLTHHGALD